MCGGGYAIANYTIGLIAPDASEWIKVAIGNVLGTALVALLAFSVLYFRRRFRDRAGEIEDLRNDLQARQKSLDKARIELAELRDQDAKRKSQLPEAALHQAKAYLRSNSFVAADNELLNWVDAEGRTVSDLMLQLAEWAMAHAAADLRSAGLAAAESYATAAIALFPRNHDAFEFLRDTQAIRAEEVHPPVALPYALTEFREHVAGLFQPELVETAEAAEAEAQQRLGRGYFRAALPTVERALAIRLSTLGNTAVQTLRTQLLKARILIFLGRSFEAWPIACSTRMAMEDNPSLGPSHPDTLSSRELVAAMLRDLGCYEEALQEARAVVKAREDSPSLGPLHPDTLLSRRLVASVLEFLGRYAEALQEAQEVTKAMEEDPSLGASHPKTLSCRELVAAMLRDLGRYEEALQEARAVVKAREDNPSLGPLAFDTLLSRLLVASVLEFLGRYEEVLQEAQEVAKAMEENPSLGTSHPQTLSSRHRVASALRNLGRYGEALQEARAVVKVMEENPSLGASHPETLASRYLVASVLEPLGRYEEALQEAQEVAKAMEENPSLGASHPYTLASRELVASVHWRCQTAHDLEQAVGLIRNITLQHDSNLFDKSYKIDFRKIIVLSGVNKDSPDQGRSEGA